MLRRLTELRVPPWSARTKLHAPSRPAPCGAGQDMAKRSPSSQKIGRLLQHPPSPLSTRSRNRVRYKVGCVRVPVRGVCGVLRGAWGASGAPVSPGLVRRRGLLVCLVYCSCCLLPAVPVLVLSDRAVASLCPAWSLMCPAVSARRRAGQSHSSMSYLLSDRHRPFQDQTRT